MDDKTLKEVYDSMTEEQRMVLVFVVKKATEELRSRIKKLEAFIALEELLKED